GGRAGEGSGRGGGGVGGESTSANFTFSARWAKIAKHCGAQPTWSIGLELLYKKSGSKEPLRNFRIAIKKLTESNHLPDYRLRFHPEEDKLTVYLRSHKGGLRELKDVLSLA